MRERTLQIRPVNGGALMSSVTADAVGEQNYVAKEDWRRVLASEKRREGYDYFWPNTTGDFSANPQNQPFPNRKTLVGVTSITVADGVATVSLDNPHTFSDGQRVRIDGAESDNLNSVWEIRDVGFLEFKFDVDANDGTDNSVGMSAVSAEKITLLHRARSPNGKTAVLAGTRSHLFRFFSLDSGPYFEAGYIDPDYFEENPGDWVVIGDGFNVAGSRWQAVDINGWVILSNGIDLPVTYRIEDMAVQPIWELRELGVAFVGSISKTNGLLVLADIAEIKDDAFEDIFRPLSSGLATAAQGGAMFSEGTTGSVSANEDVVTASANIFEEAMEGSILRFTNGFSREIAEFISATSVRLSGPNTAWAITDLPFFISDESSFEVVSSAAFFDESMVGLDILWDDGAVRRITEFVDSETVMVDTDMPVDSGTFSIENTDAYAPFTREDKINRIQYRTLWSSIIDHPRRFGSFISSSIQEGSSTLVLDHPARSLSIGDEVLIIGAGELGGNLIAKIIYIAGDKFIQLDKPAIMTATNTFVQRADAAGGFGGFEDLQDDGSPIVNMLQLGQSLIVYKPTAIFIMTFTANPEQPFGFQIRKIKSSDSLYYKNTLVMVQNQFHIYAGRNSFFSFDLTNQVPRLAEIGETIKDLFFDEVSLSQTDDIFAADNELTREVWFSVPGAQQRAICYDYNQNTLSTTTMPVSAASTVKRPETGVTIGPVDDWFVMAISDMVVLYGLSTEDVPAWGGAREIYYRRHAFPFSATKHPYLSRLKSGLMSMGDPHHDKVLQGHIVYPSSFNQGTEINVSMRARMNPNSNDIDLFSRDIEVPRQNNLTSAHFMAYFFDDEIQVLGKDNPVSISGRDIAFTFVRGNSAQRKPS